MNDFESRLQKARETFGTDWSDAERAEVAGRLRATVRRRAMATRLSVSVVLALVGVFAWVRLSEKAASPQLARAPTSPSTGLSRSNVETNPKTNAETAGDPKKGLEPSAPRDVLTRRRNETRLADGSRIWAEIGTRWRVVKVSTRRVVVRLERGRLELDVPHQKSRRFLVEAGRFRIVDLGTLFAVERADRRVHVTVQEGAVRVEADRALSLKGPRVRSLNAGDTLVLHESVNARTSAKSRWQKLATQGDYKAAFAVMTAPSEVVSDDSGALLMAADVARWSGHPADAVAYLEKFLKLHASDRRASLAAFTLGRVLLLELSRPGEAAIAFARVRTLDPASPLTEDSWVREVEAWTQAGSSENARRAARAFGSAYPTSDRLREVESLLGGAQ
ncbi:MAG: FecR domain-containing protein [Myxococcaceae bacterium]